MPASGAGTRLFSSLLELHRAGCTRLSEIRARADQGDAAAADALRVLLDVRSLAIWPDLESRGCDAESSARIFEALLGEAGLRYDERPKGLIPFHLYGRRAVSAFIEHAYDAAALTRDGRGEGRLHVTVSPSQAPGFGAEWERHRQAVEEDACARLRLEISEQSPSTDGVAIDPDGNLARDQRGQVLFRPGGHGALLANLAGFHGDIVFVRNIDNIARRDVAERALPCRQLMCGLLLQLEAGIRGVLEAVLHGWPVPPIHPDVDGVWWTVPDPAWPGERRLAHVMDQLNRPIRVCGVVPASGHAGGGPFWVHGRGENASLQIVESAELDMSGPAVRSTMARATHFNPVDMVCALRNVYGTPFTLHDFASPERVIITEKTVNGVPTRVYQHPGLWNGGMARWLTLFVEVPAFTFNPVKSLSDLLQDGHRP